MADNIRNEVRTAPKVELVSQTINMLVDSYTSGYPVTKGTGGLNSRPLADIEKRQIDWLITTTTPGELVKLIFKKPPQVTAVATNKSVKIVPQFTVAEPIEDDIRTSKQTLSPTFLMDDRAKSSLGMLENFCRDYLNSPAIYDNLSTEQRELWNKGLLDVLRMIDSHDLKHPSAWTNAFKQRFEHNRFNLSLQQNIIKWLDSVKTLSNNPVFIMPPDIKESLETIISGLKSKSSAFQNGKTDNEKLAASKKFADYCRGVFGIFKR